MTHSDRDFASEVASVRKFLVDSGWIEKVGSESLDFFYAPKDLGITENYSIALPKDPRRGNIGNLLSQAVDALQDIYGFQFTDLLGQLATKSELDGPARFSFRFVDKETSAGAMPVSGLAAFLEQVQKGIYRAIKFKVDGSSDAEGNPAADELARGAKFLQTEQGSFIARIEIPFAWLSQPDLFDKPPVSSYEICSDILSAIQFLNQRILVERIEFDSEITLSESISLFDPDLLDCYSKMLIGPAVDQIDVAMQIGSQIRRSSTGILTQERIDRLSDFVRFFREYCYNENAIDIVGKIVELRSRDPNGDRNHVRILANLFGDATFFSVPLNYEQYQVAVDAHRNGTAVRLRGRGTRLKTQVRVNHVEEFGIGPRRLG